MFGFSISVLLVGQNFCKDGNIVRKGCPEIMTYTKELENIEKELREAEERARQKKEQAKIRAGKQLLDNVIFFENKLKALGIQIETTMVDMQKEEVEKLAVEVAKRLTVHTLPKEVKKTTASNVSSSQEKLSSSDRVQSLSNKTTTSSFFSRNDVKKRF